MSDICHFLLEKLQKALRWGRAVHTKTPQSVQMPYPQSTSKLQLFPVNLLCIGQIDIPRAFDTFTALGRREFDYQSLPGGGEFDPHALGVGNLNSTLDFI